MVQVRSKRRLQFRGSVNPLRADPTRTVTLRNRFRGELLSRFNRLRYEIVKVIEDDDIFGLKGPSRSAPEVMIGNAREWRFFSLPGKVSAFNSWLRTKIQTTILDPLSAGRRTLRAYIEEGLQKGAGRSYDDFKDKPQARFKPGEGAFYEGSKRDFLKNSFRQPVAAEKVELLVSRTFEELKGVTDAMAQGIARTLADGLVQGKSPRDIAKDLTAQVDGVGKKRAELLAHTEIIRAHADGQLIAIEAMGVTELGVEVEWLITPDKKLCPKCRALKGVTFSIEEARGLIPRHPRCRCSFAPAGVGEDTEEQKNTKAARLKAIRASLAGSKSDPWPGAKLLTNRSADAQYSLVQFSAWLVNVFCPTGKGGGVDPSCRKGRGLAAHRQEQQQQLDADLDRSAATERRIKGTDRIFRNRPPVTSLQNPALHSVEDDVQRIVTDEGRRVSVKSFVLYRAPDAVGRTVEQWHTEITTTPLHIYEPKTFSITPLKGGADGFRVSTLRFGSRGERDASTTLKVEDSFEVRKQKVLALLGKNPPVENVFCPTGKGGGIDPRCSPGGARSTDTLRSADFDSSGRPSVSWEKEHPHVADLKSSGRVDQGIPNRNLPDSTRPPIPEKDVAQSLNDYSWGYDGPLNTTLRAGGGDFALGKLGGDSSGKPDIDGQQMHNNLQSVFARAGRIGPPPVTVHRGLQDLDEDTVSGIVEHARKAIDNDSIVTLPGYMSTSTSAKVAEGFTGEVQFVVKAVHGLDMRPYSHSGKEDELLLNHNSRFKVDYVEQDKKTGVWRIGLDQLLPQ
jgi:SPP1 gp7 family putative phage head morphogenesis protein